jgi:hypothetical protein
MASNPVGSSQFFEAIGGVEDCFALWLLVGVAESIIVAESSSVGHGPRIAGNQSCHQPIAASER